MSNKFIIELEFGGKTYTFENPIHIISANTFLEIDSCLLEIEKEKMAGKFLAGFFSYELGYFFDKTFYDKFKNHFFSFPLLHFGVFDSYSELPFNLENSQPYEVNNLVQTVDFAEYKKSFVNIKEKLSLGETYQVNYTFLNEFNFSGSAYSFYSELKKNQSAKYSAYLESEDIKILSASPELFFEIKNSEIVSSPMKGTLEKNNLYIDKKIISENHIIVDLIRNDLGKISKIGSVQISSLLKLEEYETLNQITSTVKADLKKDLTVHELFKAILPAGSITGAPKKRTMEIILEEEKKFREVYTGGIGFFSSYHSVFNIPIRTVQIQKNQGRLGIGSGITFDSEVKKEFAECNLKMKFFLKSIPLFIFESILLKNKKLYFLEDHIFRFKKTAEFFGINFEEDKIRNTLLDSVDSYPSDQKIKISLNRNEEIILETGKINWKSKEVKKIEIADKKTNSKDIFYLYKTSIRRIYDEYRTNAQKDDIYEYIFFNEKDELTEGTITNIFVLIDSIYYTPKIDSGILNGVFRNKLLKRKGFEEKNISREDLMNSKKIFLCNSVRGIVKVELIT